MMSAMEKQRQEMQALLEQERLDKEEKVSQAQRRVADPQLQALHDRLQEMNAAGVLADETFFACEDVIADSAEGMATGGAAPDQLVQLVALSERLGADASLARQLTRKLG